MPDLSRPQPISIFAQRLARLRDSGDFEQAVRECQYFLQSVESMSAGSEAIAIYGLFKGNKRWVRFAEFCLRTIRKWRQPWRKIEIAFIVWTIFGIFTDLKNSFALLRAQQYRQMWLGLQGIILRHFIYKLVEHAMVTLEFLEEDLYKQVPDIYVVAKVKLYGVAGIKNKILQYTADPDTDMLVFDILIERGLDIDCNYFFKGWTPLLVAAKCNRWDFVRQYLHKVDKDTLDARAMNVPVHEEHIPHTILGLALLDGQKDIFMNCVSMGAEVGTSVDSILKCQRLIKNVPLFVEFLRDCAMNGKIDLTHIISAAETPCVLRSLMLSGACELLTKLQANNYQVDSDIAAQILVECHMEFGNSVQYWLMRSSDGDELCRILTAAIQQEKSASAVINVLLNEFPMDVAQQYFTVDNQADTEFSGLQCPIGFNSILNPVKVVPSDPNDTARYDANTLHDYVSSAARPVNPKNNSQIITKDNIKPLDPEELQRFLDLVRKRVAYLQNSRMLLSTPPMQWIAPENMERCITWSTLPEDERVHAPQPRIRCVDFRL